MIKEWKKSYRERQKEIDTSKLKFGIIRSTRTDDNHGYIRYTYSWHCNCGHIESHNSLTTYECSECHNTNFIVEGGVFSHYVLYKSSALHVGLTNYRYTAKINSDKKCVFKNLTNVYDFEWNVLDGYVSLKSNGKEKIITEEDKGDRRNKLIKDMMGSITRSWTKAYRDGELILIYAIKNAELGEGVNEQDRQDMLNIWDNISQITCNYNGYYERIKFNNEYNNKTDLVKIFIAPISNDKRAILSLESATKIDKCLGRIMTSEYILLELSQRNIVYKTESEEHPYNHSKIFDILEIPKGLFKSFKNSGFQFNSRVFNAYRRILNGLSTSKKNQTDKIINIMFEARKAEELYDVALLEGSNLIAILVLVYGYDIKKLLRYCCVDTKMYQGIDFKTSSITLLDYIKMSTEMSISYERYPKSLKLRHDVVAMSYKIKADEEMNDRISNRSNEVEEIIKESIPENSSYTIVLPKCASDFANEGAKLHHCIASYAEKVARKESLILFMRNKIDVDSPLVSIELSNNFNIRQASGLSNRRLESSERMFLNELIDNMKNKKKEIEEPLSA